ncbi:YdcF family protein [Tenggerimyces flavus]|uniref:YdcF family protein n=1 Tax=Tenggerimyces flavus TaxID=1708749 RepID=A0ABV7YLJ0_9ACTN|nr:YdcF family protein [Tenggerimyces flavus]MBM7787565.1 uncharacterized SAM-binding protein YcdF (DUF218 family) [Tenggerimyces flavus]
MIVLASVVGVLLLVVGWAEVVNGRASRQLTHPDRGGSEAVVVLGFRNPRPDRLNVVNRWRVRAALRSIDPSAPSTRLVFSGGPHEAELMARYATGQRGYAGEVVVETKSRSTWQNVEFSIPFVEDADRIKIVSQPLHALKARLYVQRQRPDLASRLVRSADYRLGEWAPLKPLLAAYGLLALAKARRSLAA